MPLSGGQTFAGYRIVRLLGSGGMGEVYLVEHPRLPRHNALKVLPADVSADPDYRARLNREATPLQPAPGCQVSMSRRGRSFTAVTESLTVTPMAPRTAFRAPDSVLATRSSRMARDYGVINAARQCFGSIVLGTPNLS